jgi:DNA-binding response OmpR family regulator
MVSMSKEETRLIKREKILIVDDDLDMLSLIDWHLNRLGYRTSVAVDGLDAMKRIGECKPDLVILDVMMPEVDGLKLCRWIKNNTDGMISNIHVLILSALSRPADRALALSVGATDFVTKPLDMPDLVVKIETIFNKCTM